MLLFGLGISTTCEPPLRRISLGATLLLLLVTEPCRTRSVAFSGTPVSVSLGSRDTARSEKQIKAAKVG